MELAGQSHLLGAETAQTIGTPAARHFWRISKLLRPLTITTCPCSGSRPSMRAQPTSLSTALWRPTSSRNASSLPSASKSAAAWRPPVAPKIAWAARSFSPRSRAGSREAPPSRADRIASPRGVPLPSRPGLRSCRLGAPERRAPRHGGCPVLARLRRLYSAPPLAAPYATACRVVKAEGLDRRRASACPRRLGVALAPGSYFAL